MTERRDGPTQITRRGAYGPKANVRKGIQGAILVAFLIILFTRPGEMDARAFIFGTMILVVAVDLVMLWRSDLHYTHFQSRTWSFRINAAFLAIAIGLFALALTDRW